MAKRSGRLPKVKGKSKKLKLNPVDESGKRAIDMTDKEGARRGTISRDSIQN